MNEDHNWHKRDYDWLMRGMRMLMYYYDRGTIVKHEFDHEMWYILRMYRQENE